MSFTPEKMPNCLITRELQINTTVRYHSLPTRLVKIPKLEDKFFWQGCEGIGPPQTKLAMINYGTSSFEGNLA